jgi:hypothetical protein
MTRAPYSRRTRAEQVSQVAFYTVLNQARYENAQERARERAARASARYAALQPQLAKAGYGPHGAAARIRAEARAIAARQDATRSTDHTANCQVCAEGRRMDAARAYGEVYR